MDIDHLLDALDEAMGAEDTERIELLADTLSASLERSRPDRASIERLRTRLATHIDTLHRMRGGTASQLERLDHAQRVAARLAIERES